MKLVIGNIIELNTTKEQFEIVQVFPDDCVDMAALKPYYLDSEYRETLYSIKLADYKIIK